MQSNFSFGKKGKNKNIVKVVKVIKHRPKKRKNNNDKQFQNDLKELKLKWNKTHDLFTQVLANMTSTNVNPQLLEQSKIVNDSEVEAKQDEMNLDELMASFNNDKGLTKFTNYDGDTEISDDDQSPVIDKSKQVIKRNRSRSRSRSRSRHDSARNRSRSKSRKRFSKHKK